MINKKFHKLRKGLCSILCTCLLFSQTGSVLAAEAGNDQAAQDAAALTPTPTPDPHMPAYYQAPQSNSIEGWPQGPQIEAEAAVLMDVNTETILYSKNADTQLYPASITKIMTTMLACENLDRDGSLTVSESAAYGIEPGSSSIYADTGEQFTVQQALMAIMLESANEMSLAVAEETSGSVKKFVELMNERARELGCTNTHFNNPNGLPDETHYTSANDMAKIARTAWLNPLFRKFCTRDTYQIPPTSRQPETRYLLNHHKMMAGREYAYDGVLGGKTGYTEAAGNTLVTYAKRGSTVLLAVVLNTINGGYPDTAALLDYGFNNFQEVNLGVAMEPLPLKTLACEKYILANNGNTYPFYYKKQAYVTLPAGADTSALTSQQTFLPNTIGPNRLKTEYYYNGQKVGYGMEYERNILSGILIQSSF